MFTDYLTTPLGLMEVNASDTGIVSIHFRDKENNEIKSNALTDSCKQQLKEYFSSDRTEFDLPLEHHGTVFQKQVWQALLDIPFGTVASYLNIAQAINNPKAIRAVGAANGKNPHTIIVPCHRIIGSNGTLTGYASGLERKAWLLEHEAKGGLVLI